MWNLMMKFRGKAAEAAVAKFKEVHPDAAFAVGEWMNGDPFELALALVRYGFQVPEIYGTLSGEKFHLCEAIQREISPGDESTFQSGTDHAVL